MNNLKLIEIGGSSCANCIALMPQLNILAEKFGLAFEKIDIDGQPQAVQTYRLDRIPTIVISDGDKIIGKCTGYQPQEILELWLEAKLEEYKRGIK